MLSLWASITICIQPQEDLVRDFEGMNWNSISENQVGWLERRFEEVGEGESIRNISLLSRVQIAGT